MRILASDAAAAVGGRLIGPDVEFDGASFDSRSTRPGELFVPIVAERDGHDFIGQALAAGAVAFLTSQPADAGRDGTAIEVADTAAALMALARWARRRSTATVVGVTGSVGKTSTKDFIAAACAATRRTTANERSFNNEQGLPVTILDAPDDTEVLVLEMGMRGFGEISPAVRRRPTRHRGGHHRRSLPHRTGRGDRRRGDRQARAGARRCRRRGPPCSTPTTNGSMAMAAHTGADVLTLAERATCAVIDLDLDELARPRFTIDTPWGSSARGVWR